MMALMGNVQNVFVIYHIVTNVHRKEFVKVTIKMQSRFKICKVQGPDVQSIVSISLA